MWKKVCTQKVDEKSVLKISSNIAKKKKKNSKKGTERGERWKRRRRRRN
jgi:hypothetical protein